MGGFAYRKNKLDRGDQENRKSNVIKIEDFRNLLISVTKHKFPDASIILTEKRKITVEARVKISEEIFIEVYYNTISDKK